MSKKPLALLIVGLLTVGAGAPVAVAAADRAPATVTMAEQIPHLAYQRFTLPNGLTVVVHEDHKAPVVAVSIWYHVGSSYEPKGKTGFAHLFEHLMFQGSENHRDEFFKPFELAGATDMNGTTWLDRTNYFETVPTTALDMALWMESDRMGHLLGAIGQKELDEQRGVVQNEKRQGENQPYGRVGELIQAEAFPANHPYHHDTIGSMADLNAASLGDVKQWFRDYYGAANTVLVLSGDITVAQAKEKALKYFGDIAPGPQVPRPQPWVAPRKASTRGTMTDNVAQTRIYREWNVPPRTSDDLTRLSLAAAVLGGGKTSRLYQRLVYRDRLADSVSVDIEQHALASLFQLQVDVKKSVDPTRVEAAVADEWRKFLADGPTDDELARVKTGVRASFVRGLERVNTQASILAEGQLYSGDPGQYLKDFDVLMSATPASVKAAADQWIARGDYTLTVTPGKVENTDMATVAGRPAASGAAPRPVLSPKGDYRTVKSDVDRSQGVPAVTRFPDLTFPTIQRGRLANGIEVVLAERHAVPAVQVQLMFNAGFAADQGRKLGTSSFTMAMLDEGTGRLDSVQIAKTEQRLGAEIDTGCGLDFCNASLNALDDQLTPSLALFADIVRNPAFRDADVARVRGQWLARIAQEKSQPVGIALRTLPPLLYGKGNAYAIPFTGSGTEASISSLTTQDMRQFMGDFIRPDNVKILVAGDTTLDKIIPRLNAVFGDWKASGKVPAKLLAKVAPPAHPRVYLINRPGAQQSLILAGIVAPSTEAPNNLPIETMNGAFGGTFTSRLNMNLRENKHWAYGAFSFLQPAQGQRPFLLYAPVQTDKTAESVAEMLKEARGVVGAKPLTAAEISKIKDGEVRSMPGSYQTTSAVMGALQGIVLYHRPDDYVQTLKARTEAQTDAEVNAAAKEVIHPNRFTWVIVGDLSKIEQPLTKLDLGAMQVLDADGKPVATGK